MNFAGPAFIRGRAGIIVLAAVACVGCLHTQEVEKGAAEPQPMQAEAPPVEKPAPVAAPKKPTTSAAARPPVEEGRPELSVSPQGLLVPEGARLIQEALTKKGYLPANRQTGELDSETSAALRKFQGDEKLAKTGSPDRETVRRLGLTIEKIFRSSKAAQWSVGASTTPRSPAPDR